MDINKGIIRNIEIRNYGKLNKIRCQLGTHEFQFVSGNKNKNWEKWENKEIEILFLFFCAYFFYNYLF